MNKTAYVIAAHYGTTIYLSVSATTYGQYQAITIFRTALQKEHRSVERHQVKVIAEAKDSDTQRLINTLNAFSDGKHVVNLRSNKVSHDEALNPNFMCGDAASKLRAYLGVMKEEVDLVDYHTRALANALAKRYVLNTLAQKHI